MFYVLFVFTQLTASVLGAIWVTSRFSYAWGYYTGGNAQTVLNNETLFFHLY